MLNELLSKFNSYAILSTHSPMIVQEIPSVYIKCFERFDNIPVVKEVPFESFGENLGNIVDLIFKVSEEESNYKRYLKQIFNELGEKGTKELFHKGLSLNARVYISILNHGEDD